jgi:hypothetical protein
MNKRAFGHVASAAGGAVVAVILATAGVLSATSTSGSASSKPTMEVLPRATGLKYSQTVEIKAHHLPKGSGTVAATICGLQDASGKKIAKPTADDCAGAESVGKLVQVKQWQSNGEFDTKYTLPASGQTFGKNKRDCDKTHHCALVVADANPDHPAYYISTNIQFVDQQPFGGSSSTTPTTKPKSGGGSSGAHGSSTTTTTAGVSAGATGAVSGTGNGGNSQGGNVSIHAHVSVGVRASSGGGTPSLSPPSLPPQATDALKQLCSQLTAAVKQAGGDPSGIASACDAISSGGGPAQLAAVLQSPSLLCVEGASAWQNNEQITDACNQAATGLAPVTGPVGGAIGSLPLG